MKSKNCAIVQPHYLPWIGYFELIRNVDIFVILDDVQYVKREWKNRNKIRKSPSSNDYKWISVPIKNEKKNLKINEVCIYDENNDWRNFHKDSISFVYGKAPNFDEYKDEIFNIILNKQITSLLELNLKLIKKICEILSIKTPIVLSSDYMVEKKREFKLLEICKKLSCNTYYANNKTYEMVDKSVFTDSDVKIIPQNYKHIKYKQLYKNRELNWISHLSIIDYLFNK